MDAMYHRLMVECDAITERAQYARRFHQLMGPCTHLEIPVQYERLLLRALAAQEEPTHDYRRGPARRHRRRLSSRRRGWGSDHLQRSAYRLPRVDPRRAALHRS